ncbi:MAG: hypothetical protein ACTS3R_19935 [Inquilinaceae bacterium]
MTAPWRGLPALAARAVLAAALAAALGLGACGRKPEFVDPPQGEELDRFPRTYPSE